MINKFVTKVNLIFRLIDIQYIDIRQMFGQINQYNFDQSENSKCYQIRLSNLRRLLEGVPFVSVIKK
jgi:hypothetical protein